MATRTFTTAGVNNLWSNAANWNTGVPLNTDTAVIPVGQTCEFDVDQTAFANGITVQNNGTLQATTTAGSYVLKLQANMTGTGTFRAGTSGTAYPTNCTFEVMRGGFQISATSMLQDLNCSEPTTKYIRLSGVEAIGQTVLSVDTDVTAEVNHWKDGAIIRIDDANKGVDSEERIIAAGGIAAGTITITAGLTAQKEAGALVILISRNVKITHTSNSGNAINAATDGRIFAEIRGVAVASNAGTRNTFGGTLSNGTTGLNSEIGSVFGGVASAFTNGIGNNVATIINNALISGCSSSGFNGGLGVVVANSLISGCLSGFGGGSNAIINSTINGCGNGINTGNNFELTNVIFSNNTNDIINFGSFKSYNTAFNGTTEFSGYAGANRNITAFAESINHDQVSGAYKAWTKGGIVTKTAAVFPTGYTSSQQHACESASYYCFQNYSVTVPAGGGLVIQAFARKDALMTYLPRVWILLPGVEPFISGSPDYEAIMTNSVDTWETLVLVYANAGTASVTVTVRTVAKNAAGNAYFYPINTVLAPATYDVYNTLQSDLDNIQTRLPAALVGGRMDSSVGNIESAAISDLLDEANTVETGLTLRGAFRLMAAALAGILSGAGTNNIFIRNAVADSKVRIDATVDASGNRTAITTDTI